MTQSPFQDLGVPSALGLTPDSCHQQEITLLTTARTFSLAACTETLLAPRPSQGQRRGAGLGASQ